MKTHNLKGREKKVVICGKLNTILAWYQSHYKFGYRGKKDTRENEEKEEQSHMLGLLKRKTKHSKQHRLETWAKGRAIVSLSI